MLKGWHDQFPNGMERNTEIMPAADICFSRDIVACGDTRGRLRFGRSRMEPSRMFNAELAGMDASEAQDLPMQLIASSVGVRADAACMLRTGREYGAE